ncbi:hypothetical protein ASC75_08430 [Aminobacter sp. DSM 101952]|uniref:hypothetical protein n=1 Tax=Aminobacter sp. DSM 101952 TaxID=2735891 RepID=UPI0006FBF594|nr:hypothetical protein [Aminobacter sp. DSM 101952]KQU66653.1 hypothetical protein ASC75_08430 [Aminobacter sp. DSM 101952]
MTKIDLKFETLTIGHELDTKRLASAFFAEDALGVVVRCHFEVERAAIRALDTLTGNRWRKTRSQYLAEKLNLLEMLGAPEPVLVPARTLNKQRNAFAHDGLEEISEQQLLDIVRGIRDFLPQFQDDYRIQLHGEREFSGAFKECSIHQKYAVASSILAMLVGGIPEFMRAYREAAVAADKAPDVLGLKNGQ